MGIPAGVRITPHSLGQALGRLAVGALVPIVGLLVLRLILSSLPMIKNAGPMGDTALTPLLLIKAIMDTIIYALTIRLAMQAGQAIQSYRPALAEVGTIVRLVGLALVATLAYSGYEAFFLALFRSEQADVYNWVFLALVLVPIAAILVIVSRRLSYFNELIFGQITRTTRWEGAAGAPPGNPPSLPEQRQNEALARLQRTESQVSAARTAADQMRSRGTLPADLETAASKMEGYLHGAQEAARRQDQAQITTYLDWAEYEATRVMTTAGGAR